MRNFVKKAASLCVFSVLFLLSIKAAAALLDQQQIQTAYSIAGQVDPGRVSSSVEIPALLSSKGLNLSLATTHKTQSIAAASKIHFVLHQVIFTGNTVFTTAELSRIFLPYLHKDISLAQLQLLVDQVTTHYRSAGYILSRAILPPQEIKQGVVHVQVIEGFISDIIIKGDNAGRSAALVKSYAQHITESRPLKMRALEKYLLLINDLPDIDVQSVMSPAKAVPGGADLTLILKKTAGSANFFYNNYGTRYIGPNQTTVNGSLYALFAPGDSNMAQIVTAPRQELRFGEFIHAQPVGSQGLTLNGGGSYTETRPEFVLAPLDIVGRNFSLFGNGMYPLIRSRAENIYLQGTANYQNVSSTILNGAPFYNDLIRSLVISMVFNNLDHWQGVNTLNVNIEHGFPILGAHDHFYQSRPEGHVLFTKETATISRLQALGSRYSVLASMTGQYTNVPLLATEQFGFGGPDYGRGYDPSEMTGDKGIAAKLEGRVDTFPSLHFLPNVQYYIFYDAGEIWNLDKINLPPQQSATSIGIGTRFTVIKAISGDLYLAKPLTREVSTMMLLGRNATAPRGFFQLVASL